MIRLLLDRGADPNFKHRMGRENDPLCAALNKGRLDVIDELRQRGARLNGVVGAVASQVLVGWVARGPMPEVDKLELLDWMEGEGVDLAGPCG